MVRWTYIMLTCTFALILAACPGINSPQDPVYLELQNLSKKVDSAQQSNEARLKSIESKVERLSRNMGGKGTSTADLNYQLNQLKDEVGVLRQLLTDDSQRLNEISDTLTFIRQSLAKSSISTNQNPESSSSPSSSITPTESPEAMYQTALNDYRNHNYELAISGFKGFIKAYPKTILAGNAQYWIGESYYSMQKYEQAIQELELVLTRYSKNAKVPAALLKQAYSFAALNRTSEAKSRLKRVITSYAHSREAALATQKLKQLGG